VHRGEPFGAGIDGGEPAVAKPVGMKGEEAFLLKLFEAGRAAAAV
jgi:hypothetical protein